MSEVARRDGSYPLNSESLLLEAHRLVSVFAASPMLAGYAQNPLPDEFADRRPVALGPGVTKEFVPPGRNSPFAGLRGCEESEIARLIISIAACVRNSMDLDRSWEEAMLWCESVGTLQDGPISELVETPLSFREACHKIIHATRVNFDYSFPPDDEPLDLAVCSLEPRVHLYGTYRKRDWKATLEIYPFVHNVVAIS